MPTLIYKIATRAEWDAAQALSRNEGSGDDARDGFIHFSSPKQLAATAAKHFAGQSDLVLVAVDGEQLGERLRWEPSRGGELFPHLYGPLSLEAVIGAADLRLDAGGRHEVAEALQRLDERAEVGHGSPEAPEGAIDEGACKTAQGLAP